MQTELDDNTIVAMACAALAEQLGIEIRMIRIKSFKKIEPSPLQKYLSENGIEYVKYTLEAENNG